MPSSIDILTRVLKLIQQLDPNVQSNATELEAVMSALKQVESGLESVKQKFEARSAEQLQQEINRFKAGRSASSDSTPLPPDSSNP
jgi:septal ring factor EnvC (AmiA/AmiB activator)